MLSGLSFAETLKRDFSLVLHKTAEANEEYSAFINEYSEKAKIIPRVIKTLQTHFNQICKVNLSKQFRLGLPRMPRFKLFYPFVFAF
ncbi:hypothetical protein KKB3_01482 [Dehalococcoides mccartyi]|nr:hypothetical protein KKB3_01482 [Dehalococcoides mccartyi]